jgi:hypothetical protein
MGNTLNIITTIIAFILFISMIPAVFSLSTGFMITEFIIYIILLVIGAGAIIKLLSGRHAWTCMFGFFFLNIINIFAIFTRTFELAILAIPLIVTLIGLYISAFKIKKCGEDVEIEPYYEAEHEVEVEEEKPKKKTAKKKAKKKK